QTHHAAHSSKSAPPRQTSRPTPAPADHGVAQAPAAAPALDLKSLQERLRNTSAIGVFTKLSLKNQVDDLLGSFRAYHGGQAQPSLEQLRQRYNDLLGKVVGLLKSEDAPLAATIASSRDAIWAKLADRHQFETL
ncbi:MAG: hypothetical protein M3O06_11120, partial [Pseudomonadota bacterium]|nr:hypothetical protein [Pseudomonadota bacterium]